MWNQVQGMNGVLEQDSLQTEFCEFSAEIEICLGA